MLDASKSFGEVSQRVWHNKNLSIRTKFAAYGAIIQSTYLNGAEPRILYKDAGLYDVPPAQNTKCQMVAIEIKKN